MLAHEPPGCNVEHWDDGNASGLFFTGYGPHVSRQFKEGGYFRGRQAQHNQLKICKKIYDGRTATGTQ